MDKSFHRIIFSFIDEIKRGKEIQNARDIRESTWKKTKRVKSIFLSTRTTDRTFPSKIGWQHRLNIIASNVQRDQGNVNHNARAYRPPCCHSNR